jgi:hypothetical protein
MEVVGDVRSALAFYLRRREIFLSRTDEAAMGLELWLNLGDGVDQAADLASGATSIPSWNLTPWMTFGNWF